VLYFHTVCTTANTDLIPISFIFPPKLSQRTAPQEVTSTGLRQSARDRVPKRAFGATDSIDDEVHIDAFGLQCHTERRLQCIAVQPLCNTSYWSTRTGADASTRLFYATYNCAAVQDEEWVAPKAQRRSTRVPVAKGAVTQLAASVRVAAAASNRRQPQARHKAVLVMTMRYTCC
jgi:hypothetical protein